MAQRGNLQANRATRFEDGYSFLKLPRLVVDVRFDHVQLNVVAAIAQLQ